MGSVSSTDYKMNNTLSANYPDKAQKWKEWKVPFDINTFAHNILFVLMYIHKNNLCCGYHKKINTVYDLMMILTCDNYIYTPNTNNIVSLTVCGDKRIFFCDNFGWDKVIYFDSHKTPFGVNNKSSKLSNYKMVILHFIWDILYLACMTTNFVKKEVYNIFYMSKAWYEDTKVKIDLTTCYIPR